jgi:hypothetical protein
MPQLRQHTTSLRLDQQFCVDGSVFMNIFWLPDIVFQLAASMRRSYNVGTEITATAPDQ